MPFMSYLGDKAAISDVFMRRPETYVHLARFAESVLRGPSQLSVGERELIAAYSSALNACQFCVGVHTEVAGALGVPPKLVDQIVDDPTTAPVSDKLRPILLFVRKLTQTPARMTQADADAVFGAGWDEDALHDAVAVCGLFNMNNRIVEGHGIKDAGQPFAAIGNYLATQGYAARFT